jgi:cellobiose transport system permease protein
MVRHPLLRRAWRHRAQYLAIAPFYVWFLAFGLYPLLYSLALSLHSWSGFGPWSYVGLRNYLGLLSDDVFWRSLANSLYFFVFMVPILTVGSLALAILLNAGAVRGRGPLRTIFFLPHITSTIIVSILFLSLLDDKYGWLNAGLQSLGAGPIPWLHSKDWSKWSVMLLLVWRNIGYYMIIMLAGLQSIEREIYEAAAIDGATALRSHLYITVPLMRPMIIFVVIVTTMMILNMFEVPFMLTKGGPEWSSTTLTLTLFNYAFQYRRYGDASALAFVISGLVLAITMAQLRFLRGRA